MGRAQAKELLGKIAKGIDPRKKEQDLEETASAINHPTLRQAWNGIEMPT
jgi:hypothetical protein